MRNFQIDIPKRSSICCGKGERLTSGMEYYSLLVNDPEKGIQRRDFCLECWKNTPEHEKASDEIVSWRSKVAGAKEMPNGPTERDQRIHNLFHSPSDEEDPAEKFILAIYLQRKKRLYLRSEFTDDSGKIFLLYEIPETEEMLPIQKVPLSGISVQNIQKRIAEKLNGSTSACA